MLSYLDELCAALIARDRSALRDLLANDLACTLPAEVREEIEDCLTFSVRNAPLRTLHFYYQHMQRERVTGSMRVTADLSPLGDRAVQIELPLSAA